MSTETQDAPRFTIKGQYIKDLSFENPHAPHSLAVVPQKPAVNINVELRGQKLDEQNFEIVLQINVRATVENGTLFLCELAYAGIFEVVNVSDEKIEPLIWVEGPTVLFPFARRVIADITRDGGFPPIMLEPIDFQALYLNNKSRAIRAGA